MQRGQNLRKLPSTAREEIAVLRQSGKTLKEIGDIYGVSRERIRQLAPADLKCRVCRKTYGLGEMTGRSPHAGGFYNSRGLRGWVCRGCRDVVESARTCKCCGTSFVYCRGESHTYCPRCAHDTRPCVQCGTPITRSRAKNASEFRNKQWFCDRSCFATWLGTNYGKQNLEANRRVRTEKFRLRQLEAIPQLLEGLAPREVAETIGVAVSTVHEWIAQYPRVRRAYLVGLRNRPDLSGVTQPVRDEAALLDPDVVLREIDS